MNHFFSCNGCVNCLICAMGRPQHERLVRITVCKILFIDTPVGGGFSTCRVFDMVSIHLLREAYRASYCNSVFCRRFFLVTFEVLTTVNMKMYSGK